MSKQVWHYTVGEGLIRILSDGFIRPATAHIHPSERPITWASTEQFWEPSVSKGVMQGDGTIMDLGMNALIARGITLARIGSDPDAVPHIWAELKALSQMPTAIAQRSAAVAKQKGGNPSRWRGSFGPIPVEKWTSVENFNPSTGQWESLCT
jgi:hypothetical protein